MHPNLSVPGWNAEPSLGNALLDRQHILLIGLARTLVRDLPALDRDAVLLAGQDILTLARQHCAAEEDCLLRNGYEWLEQHREEHAAGLDRLQSHWGEVARGTLPPEHFVAAVIDWLHVHLEDMDLPAREYLAQLANTDETE